MGNVTGPCPAPSSSAGLAVGLTLFFLLLAIIAAVVVYKFHSKIRSIVQFRQGRSQEKEDPIETPQTEPHQYTSMRREQSTGQTPIYENLTTRNVGCNQPTASESRSPDEHEEDLYLQCDMQDDAIYSNDPAFNSVPPEFQEEDLYVVPDAL